MNRGFARDWTRFESKSASLGLVAIPGISDAEFGGDAVAEGDDESLDFFGLPGVGNGGDGAGMEVPPVLGDGEQVGFGSVVSGGSTVEIVGDLREACKLVAEGLRDCCAIGGVWLGGEVVEGVEVGLSSQGEEVPSEGQIMGLLGVGNTEADVRNGFGATPGFDLDSGVDEAVFFLHLEGGFGDAGKGCFLGLGKRAIRPAPGLSSGPVCGGFFGWNRLGGSTGKHVAQSVREWLGPALVLGVLFGGCHGVI